MEIQGSGDLEKGKIILKRKRSSMLNLSISIDSSWKTSELIDLLDIITYWYNISFFISMTDKRAKNLKIKESILTRFNLDSKSVSQDIKDFIDRPSSTNLQLLVENFPDNVQLQLKALKYNSPGKIDVFGIGEIIKQIKEFIKDIVNYRQNREIHRLNVSERVQKIKSAKIDNLDKTLSILKKYDIPLDTVNQILEQKEEDKLILKRFRRNRQITEITTYDKDK